MTLIQILTTLILVCVSVFVYYLIMYSIRTAIISSRIKNEHIYMIKQACKLGQLNKLIKNCTALITDYTDAYKNVDIAEFYVQEYFMQRYKHMFLVSYKILKYLDNSTIYEKYKKLNNKHRKKVL